MNSERQITLSLDNGNAAIETFLRALKEIKDDGEMVYRIHPSTDATQYIVYIKTEENKTVDHSVH